MFEKLKLFINALHQGEILKNAVKIKNWTLVINTATGMAATGLLIAKAFGYDIPLTSDDLVMLGGGALAILGLFNQTSAVVTSTKIGLPAKSDSGPAPVDFGVLEPSPKPVPVQADLQINTQEPRIEVPKPGDNNFG